MVSQEASEVSESQQALTTSLYVAVPIVVLALGLTTWVLVGRALAPVEAIRAEVDRITADRLGSRVPQPSSRDEVGELARTMNAMLERLETSHDRQRRLVSDASHELRSPATVIRQHAEVALSHPGSTSTEELARVTLAEGRRLEQLVEQLLWLARTDETTAAPRLRPLDLDDLVLEEASRVRATTAVTVDTSRVSGGTGRRGRPDAAPGDGQPAGQRRRPRHDDGLGGLVRAPGVTSCSGWTTTARGSRPPTGSGCWSASCGSTRSRSRRGVARGSAWR